MPYYPNNYPNSYNNKPFKKPKTVGFDDVEAEEEDIEEIDCDTDIEEEDQYGELVLGEIAKLNNKLDDFIKFVKEHANN